MGAIAGLAIGGVALFVLLAGVLWLRRRKKTQTRTRDPRAGELPAVSEPNELYQARHPLELPVSERLGELETEKHRHRAESAS